MLHPFYGWSLWAYSKWRNRLTPVVQGDIDCPLGQLVVSHGWVCGVSVATGVVEQRLGDTEEEEPGSDAAGEQHHEPCWV